MIKKHLGHLSLTSLGADVLMSANCNKEIFQTKRLLVTVDVNSEQPVSFMFEGNIWTKAKSWIRVRLEKRWQVIGNKHFHFGSSRFKTWVQLWGCTAFEVHREPYLSQVLYECDADRMMKKSFQVRDATVNLNPIGYWQLSMRYAWILLEPLNEHTVPETEEMRNGELDRFRSIHSRMQSSCMDGEAKTNPEQDLCQNWTTVG